jgi:hypothetical protein
LSDGSLPFPELEGGYSLVARGVLEALLPNEVPFCRHLFHLTDNTKNRSDSYSDPSARWASELRSLPKRVDSVLFDPEKIVRVPMHVKIILKQAPYST